MSRELAKGKSGDSNEYYYKPRDGGWLPIKHCAPEILAHADCKCKPESDVWMFGKFVMNLFPLLIVGFDFQLDCTCCTDLTIIFRV